MRGRGKGAVRYGMVWYGTVQTDSQTHREITSWRPVRSVSTPEYKEYILQLHA